MRLGVPWYAPLQLLNDPRTTSERLIEAALELVAERGYKGATTRLIAQRAGVAEVTLFRAFGSKQQLIAAAAEHLTRDLRGGFREPSDDLRADLLSVAERYTAMFSAYRGVLLRLLPEIPRQPALQAVVIPYQRGVMVSLSRLVAHYVARGELKDKPVREILLDFLGPLLAREFLKELFALSIDATFLEAHVDAFLEGYRASAL